MIVDYILDYYIIHVLLLKVTTKGKGWYIICKKTKQKTNNNNNNNKLNK